MRSRRASAVVAFPATLLISFVRHCFPDGSSGWAAVPLGASPLAGANALLRPCDQAGPIARRMMVSPSIVKAKANIRGPPGNSPSTHPTRQLPSNEVGVMTILGSTWWTLIHSWIAASSLEVGKFGECFVGPGGRSAGGMRSCRQREGVSVPSCRSCPIRWAALRRVRLCRPCRWPPPG